MARPPTAPASPSTLAPALLRWLAAHGVARDRRADEDEVAITPQALAMLLSSAAELVGEPHVALRLPRELVYRRYDALALAARAASTPEAVLALHVRFAALVFPQLEATLSTDATELQISMSVRGYPRGLGVAVDEYLVATCLDRCRGGGPALSPLRVFFTAARPRDLSHLHDTFATRDIDFGRETCGFVLATSDARRPLAGHDEALLATAEHLAHAALEHAPAPGALRDVVAARIEATLPNDVSADAVAGILHMSSRTLQRRLEAEGTSWREVLDRVRERRARSLLRDESLTLGEVAYRAGFADLATFSRAFKRWTGHAPGAFRRATSG